MYHVLEADAPGDAGIAALQCDFANAQEAGRDWIAGHRFDSEPPTPLVLHSKSRPGTALPALRQTPIPLMTKNLHAALCAAGVSNLVTYAAEIRSPGGTLVSGDHVAFNVIGTVHSGAAEGGLALSSQRLDAAGAKGHLLFRIVDAPYALVVSETLRLRLVSAAIDGLRFTPLAQWAG